MSLFLSSQQTIFKYIYKTFGSAPSTKLSQTFMGKLFSILLSGNKKGLNIYKGEGNIKLKLTNKEVKDLGFLYLGVINILETDLIKKLLKPGDLFIDIGAYIDGWHSLVASKIVGNDGKVHVFEPLYYKRLTANIKINKTGNIILNRKAVSDKNGWATFYDDKEASSLINSVGKRLNKYKVRTVTLDTYIKTNKVKKVTLVKIDTEGAEEKVLKGAKNLLSIKEAPDILIEVVDGLLERAGSNRFKVIKLLKTAGYTPYVIKRGGKIEKYRKQSDQKLNNLFFSKKTEGQLKDLAISN